MPLAQSDFTYISQLVRQRAAIVLEVGKEYLVESRLTPLATSESLDGISGLVAGLQADRTGRLASKVVDAMTTNETLFFRDGHPFDTLRTIVLPELMKARSAARRLSIWCGASSSGQEPYTLAMVLKETLPPGFGCDLLATDVNEEMLERTRKGTYSQLEVNRGLPITSLVKHFDKEGTSWQVKPELRSMIQTKNVNLATCFPSMGPFDLVFLRNVLIYFDLGTKREVLQQVRRVLRPDGYLFLGGAETTINVDDSWQRVTLGQSTAYRPKDP
ncbi:MAG: protein-glutamate O-methyltransferase CheR [Mycobacteriales bacterium]|nr:protein-glutamate O-methyltransferase CheR [Mycobacteriales bacterium]